MRYNGSEALSIADEISRTYADVFTEPPWDKAHDRGWEVVLAAFRDRFRDDAQRPGFRLIVAMSATGVDGFASGWITRSPFPSDRAYHKVTSSIGADRVDRLLVGAVEVDELAVRASARGRGLGRSLLSDLIADAPDGAAWLLTWTGAPGTVEFYRRAGWYRVPVASESQNDIVTYLSPGHPVAGDG